MDTADTEIVERQISEIVKSDLYERFPTGFTFDPIRVYPRTDHMGDDYLKVFVIYEGNTDELDPAKTFGLITRLKPKLRELNINDYISAGFVEKSEWDSLSEVPLL